MPRVHPKAATTLARAPRDRPAANVNRTPVPGEATTIRDVIRKSVLIEAFPFEGDGSNRQHASGGGHEESTPSPYRDMPAAEVMRKARCHPTGTLKPRQHRRAAPWTRPQGSALWSRACL